jgi:hypothetical protein
VEEEDWLVEEEDWLVEEGRKKTWVSSCIISGTSKCLSRTTDLLAYGIASSHKRIQS